MKEFLSDNGIEFIYIDITSSMFNLKTFLKYRDNRDEFEEIKKKGYVGLPCIMVNKGEKFFFDKPDLSELKEE